MKPAGLDLEALRGWIGRTESATDVVSERLATAFEATLGRNVSGDGLALLALHWCLAPAAASADRLGEDGHPFRGTFLPPVPLPRRMWAGGELTFHRPLRVGDHVTRVSRIADVTAKYGGSGLLCFVVIEHQLSVAQELAILERQDIVYREAPGASPASRPEAQTPAPEPTWRQSLTLSSPLLFRYSALTFNAHRIHYDRDYARNVEGYPGLVVHAPLQATLLLHAAARIRNGVAPRTFSYRGVRPLIEGNPISLNARDDGVECTLWVADSSLRPTLTAAATWT